MKEPLETAELMTFVRAVEAGSISRAARELRIPRPTAARRLGRLEEKLGVRLLRRTTRNMAMTDAGEILYARARTALAAVSDAEVSVRRKDEGIRGLLRVSAPPIQNDDFFAMITGFIEQHSEVRLELEMTTRHIDFVSGGFDVAIRATSQLAPGLIARNLFRTRLVVVAAPSYLGSYGTPRKSGELGHHRCLAGFALGEHPATHWPLVRGGSFRIEPHFASNDISVLRAAALRGQGLALLPINMIYDDIVEGRLTTVLTEKVGAETQLSIVYPEREFVPPAVRAFVDATLVWAKGTTAFRRDIPSCEAHTKEQRLKGKR